MNELYFMNENVSNGICKIDLNGYRNHSDIIENNINSNIYKYIILFIVLVIEYYINFSFINRKKTIKNISENNIYFFSNRKKYGKNNEIN